VGTAGGAADGAGAGGFSAGAGRTAGGGACEVEGEICGGAFVSGAGWTGGGETGTDIGEEAGLAAGGAVWEASAVWAAGSEAALRACQSRQT
jgi:hypothetical protein